MKTHLKPNADLKFERAEVEYRSIAVFAKIYMRDDKGNLWFFEAAEFCYNLQQAEDPSKWLICKKCTDSAGSQVEAVRHKRGPCQ